VDKQEIELTAQNIIAIKNGRIATPVDVIDDGVILVKNSKIEAVGEKDKVAIPRDALVIDARGRIVTPGFIDVHVHGGGGSDVMDGSYDALNEMSTFEAKHGTTGFLPTPYTDSQERLLASVKAIETAVKRGTSGGEVLGIHLEGPYINIERKGGQPAEYIRKPDLEELRLLLEASNNNVKMITLAPEVKGGLEFVRRIIQYGVVASIGHSNATYDEALRAVDAGVSHACHAYNAMREFHHREPGVVGAMLSCDELTAELIADGIHVHPAAMKILVKCKETDRIILVTDAVVGTGMEGRYKLGGRDVVITKKDSRFLDGSLAGSVLTMDSAVRNIMGLVGVSLQDAVKMATVNPAKRIGVYDRKGSLEAGKDADITIVDDQLNVYMTMVTGKIVYER
jgi:N-acetylglucosamine-6-phosphate deacetylase